MEYKMADKKSKKEIPDRVAEWTKKLPFISYTTPRAGHVSQYKDKANALLERMLGDKEKPKAGPKGNVKKMAEGGKTGMRGQVKKDDMNKKAVNSAVKEAMDSTHEGKINPPKEPDMGVAKARMSLARLDLIVQNLVQNLWKITAVDRGNLLLEGFNYGGKVSKMAMGGKCRGMGAATKGGSFSKNG
jgi:hypothetical protein